MTTDNKISFSISGKIPNSDRNISPESVSLSDIQNFIAEVREFIAAGVTDKEGKKRLDSIPFSIESGSFMLTGDVDAIASLDPTIHSDIKALFREDGLDDISSARAKIVAQWQDEAKKQNRTIHIGSPYLRQEDGSYRGIDITPKTQYRHSHKGHWVPVQIVIRGKMFELGGKRNPNLHIQDESTGRESVVKTTFEQVETIKELLMKKVIITADAERNSVTKEIREIRLISAKKAGFSFSPELLDKAIQETKGAWKDISDPAAWVRQVRGLE